ncbi:Uncharacterized conserved protein, DUF1015 family [Pustulibacterium marinum]|uniref:Uncharacterized conserved protein, DUF1015 family n=1 Tax=Pustulibacterium marinum TaxID=1224947 RepID=A0A1I7ILA0_9FLAO|nr:DUF1015 domain-containing protein [Pustulibacterium marinum]SFU73665.1 Uncharacterized conserved protein, DUF1015 family [Pustulibacterium marinum]
MPKITPFKAVLPHKAFASLVVSRSYETYKKKELKAKLAYNPYSFLHILNPGFKFQHEISGMQRFNMVKNRYLEFHEREVYEYDDQEAFYLYQIETHHHKYTGIIAAASVEDYKNNRIKKHEDTIQRREEIFKEYLKVVGFNTEPVLLTYPDDSSINEITETVTQTVPDYQFATVEQQMHSLWKINNPENIAVISQHFEAMEAVYIADGHHRSASSMLLSDEMFPQTGNEKYTRFLSFLIPESNLHISEFNRLIKGLNGLSKEEFLYKLDEDFRIENRGLGLYQPSKKHHFSMYLDGEFYSLYLRKSKYNFNDSLSELDTQLLYKTILEPILGIHDLRNDDRIAYVSGKESIIRMKKKIDDGDFTVGFGMLPITVEELKKIADEGLQMPPKSTYIEPKLLSGLTIYEF